MARVSAVAWFPLVIVLSCGLWGRPGTALGAPERATPRERQLETTVADLTRRLLALEQQVSELKAAPASAISTPASLAAQAPLPVQAQATPLVNATTTSALPAALKPASPPAGKVNVGPQGKGTVFASADGRNTLKLQGRVQTLYHQQYMDQAEDQGGFQLRRLKLVAAGQADGKANEYQLMLEASSGNGPTQTDRVRVDDFWFQHTFDPEFKVRLGQFKTPFSRQWIGSVTALTFTDWPLAGRVFASNPPAGEYKASDFALLPTHGVGRNIGVQLWGDLGERSILRWFAGAFNGEGQNGKNKNSGLMYVGRLEWMPWGDVPYTEGSQMRPKDALLALDAGFALDERTEIIDIDRTVKTGLFDREDRRLSNLGYSFKWRRFDTQGEYFRQWTDPVATALPRIGSDGWYLEAGYLLSPDNWELSWRESEVDPDRAIALDVLHESGPSIVYYLNGHDHKVIADVMRLTDEANAANDQTRARVLYYFSF